MWVYLYIFITSYSRCKYESFKISALINFKALIFLSSSFVIIDLPSIRVGVSLPPIKHGATTSETLSTKLFLRRIEFKLPPDCKVIFWILYSFFNLENKSTKSISFS